MTPVTALPQRSLGGCGGGGLGLTSVLAAITAVALLGELQGGIGVAAAPPPRVCLESGLEVCPPHANCNNASDDTEILTGQTLRIAMYADELATCNAPEARPDRCERFEEVTREENNNASAPIWTGYEVDLIEKLAVLGTFEYTIISMGNARGISQEAGGYTQLANVFLGRDASEDVENGDIWSTLPHDTKADLLGQGTWRASEDRAKWATWSVPVVTEDVWLLYRGPELIRNSFLTNAWLVFAPFSFEVWMTLGFAIVLMTIIFWCCASKVKYTVKERGVVDMFYTVCMTPFSAAAKGRVDLRESHIRGVAVGWIVFMFLATAAYTSNLTKILSLPPTYAARFVSIDEVVGANASFCVNRGSANANFYGNSPKLTGNKKATNLTFSLLQVASVDDQIANTLRGYCNHVKTSSGEWSHNESCCSSTETTKEDLAKWTDAQGENAKNKRCKLHLSKRRITRRSRGMMTLKNNTCIINGINALYKKFQEPCPPGSTEPECNAKTLYDYWFPETDCTDTVTTSGEDGPQSFWEQITDTELTSPEYALFIERVNQRQGGERDSPSLDIKALTGMYALLFIFFGLGGLATVFGRTHRRLDNMCLGQTASKHCGWCCAGEVRKRRSWFRECFLESAAAADARQKRIEKDKREGEDASAEVDKTFKLKDQRRQQRKDAEAAARTEGRRPDYRTGCFGFCMSEGGKKKKVCEQSAIQQMEVSFSTSELEAIKSVSDLLSVKAENPSVSPGNPGTGGGNGNRSKTISPHITFTTSV
jgi:hypothetical protein